VIRVPHLGLQAFVERYDPEVFDYAHVLHYGDQEPFLLEIPLKAQVMTTDETIEHIPCGLVQQGSICVHGLWGWVYYL
jgi:hypothetical protein